MQLKPGQLASHLSKQLAPIYLVSGDEPLQQMESCDAIREAARKNGYSSREIMEVDTRFDWNRLQSEADALSLFAEKKIIDLRIPSGKPGREGGAALTAYAQNLPEDTLLLITLPKLDQAQQRSKWFTSLDKQGVVIRLWPLKDRELNQWISQRMHQAGLQPGPGAVELLAERIEGNLLAARQEIEKLALHPGPGQISREVLADSVADSARYDVFSLADTALGGDATQSSRIISGLQAEGVALPLLLWSLTREVRLLCQLHHAIKNGKSPDQALTAARVWKSRAPLVKRGLQRLSYPRCQALLSKCQQADASSKGAGDTDPWILVEQIVQSLAGRGLSTTHVASHL
ncbi:MAG: DNA polymerase III subunit delta [bacterium]